MKWIGLFLCQSRPAGIRQFLSDGDRLVGICGVETLLVIKLRRAGQPSETVLLLHDGNTFRALHDTGIKMPAQQCMRQQGLSAARFTCDSPLLSPQDSQIEFVQEPDTPP